MLCSSVKMVFVLDIWLEFYGFAKLVFLLDIWLLLMGKIKLFVGWVCLFVWLFGWLVWLVG